MKAIIVPGALTLAQLEHIYRGTGAIGLAPEARGTVEESAGIVAEAAAGAEPIYGVNTGFGKLASVKVASADTAKLQRNLILSHSAGVGAPLAADIVRLVMALKLASLG